MKLATGACFWLYVSLAAAAPDAGTTCEAASSHLKTIESLLSGGHLQAAEPELQIARRASCSTPPYLVQLDILHGMFWAASADDEQTLAVFRRALALDLKAQLPEWATQRMRKLFEQARRDIEQARRESEELSRLPPPSQGARSRPLVRESLVALVSGALSEETDLQRVKALLDKAEDRKDEHAWRLLLQGMLKFLEHLQTGPGEGDHGKQAFLEAARSHADDLKAVEVALSEDGTGDRPQVLLLREMLLTAEGLLRLGCGEEVLARTAFQRALELNPEARLPAFARGDARRLFDTLRPLDRGHSKPPSPPRPVP